jgi:hypothetical protein
MTTAVTADYLVVSAGVMGMAFADTLICETSATVVTVDRYHQPGGHWNAAYPFVRLHQPSANALRRTICRGCEIAMSTIQSSAPARPGPARVRFGADRIELSSCMVILLGLRRRTMVRRIA